VYTLIVFIFTQEMRKILFWCVIAVVSLVGVCSASNLNRLTQDPQEVVETRDINGDPIRQGADNPGRNTVWIFRNSEITSFFQAKNQTIAFIQNLINWSLWLVWLVALVYIIYHWFLMVTAAGNDAQFKKWAKSLRTAVVAILGIWLSAFIVKFIFYLLDRFY
jgi:Type IV secretion system pilin